MDKKNILIISVYYPPIESIASNRIYSFAKYLDKSKFNIFVHTVDEQKKYDNDLDGVEVLRVKNKAFFKQFTFNKRTNKLIHYSKVLYNILINKFIKNSYQNWIDDSFRLLRKKINEEKIDLIISSFAPDASHILALKLKKEFPYIKWIADMRDEMSLSPFISNDVKYRYHVLEKDICKYANAVTSVSKPILNEFVDICCNDNIIFNEIRNGYDFEIKNKKNNNSIFTISYIGNFYGEINPVNFLKSLELFIDKKNIKMKVRFIGVKTHFDISNNIKDMIEIIPYVSHKQAVQMMRDSDALLLIHPSNGRKGVYTGKLFEYLASLTPIVALVDEDDVAAKLIYKCNAGYVSDNDNIENIEKILYSAYNEWDNKEKREFNIEEIKKYHRKEQTLKLEKLILELLK